MTGNIIERDKITLGFMLRKHEIHKLMAELCVVKNDFDNAVNHSIEGFFIDKRMQIFARSPLKSYTLDEIKLQFDQRERTILHALYFDTVGMLNEDYRPCEDCVHCHEKNNKKRIDLANLNRIYCLLHPEWDFYAGLTKTNEILECRKQNWRDFYERSKTDLELLKNYLEYKLKFSNAA